MGRVSSWGNTKMQKAGQPYDGYNHWHSGGIFEACPESKDRKVLNTYNIFNLQKRHCE